ncbi:DNA-binding protein [Burkholderiaceae bacterium DAT-1]|nr:DNA-binding protein [Burkholderiaceae bacterium DAT-1]
MARAGIYKSEVSQARNALISRGINPSIDAVRIELGNTGSKSTIHRYLQELEEEEGSGSPGCVAVSEVLSDLVERLAARLKEEANEKIVEVKAQHVAQMDALNAKLAQQQAENSTLKERLAQCETQLEAEQAAHETTAHALYEKERLLDRTTQQVLDLNERLRDNEAHKISLEEKHKHAREALEHYRQSIKEQRDIEQRRHEGLLQQLQSENRAISQNLLSKQNELTQAYQDLARINAELAAEKKGQRRIDADRQQLQKAHENLNKRLLEIEASTIALTGEVQRLELARKEDKNTIESLKTQLRDSEAEKHRLQGVISIQETLLKITEQESMD